MDPLFLVDMEGETPFIIIHVAGTRPVGGGGGHTSLLLHHHCPLHHHHHHHQVVRATSAAMSTMFLLTLFCSHSAGICCSWIFSAVHHIRRNRLKFSWSLPQVMSQHSTQNMDWQRRRKKKKKEKDSSVWFSGDAGLDLNVMCQAENCTFVFGLSWRGTAQLTGPSSRDWRTVQTVQMEWHCNYIL